MALTISNNSGGAGRILYINSTRRPYTHLPLRRHVILFPSSRARKLHVVSAAKKSSTSRTGRFDSKNRRGNSALTTTDEDQKDDQTKQQTVGIEGGVGGEDIVSKTENVGVNFAGFDDGYVLSDLPGEKPDFWEGPQWDGFGFFLQYMWAFGIGFALIACAIAVATYNQGATDFKQTPAYKESIQSRDLLEEPDESNSDVFESNPTEVAPSLD